MLPGGNNGNIVQLILQYVTDEGSKQKVIKDTQDLSKAVQQSAGLGTTALAGQSDPFQKIIDARTRVTQLGTKALAEFDKQIGDSGRTVEQVEAQITQAYSKSEDGAKQAAAATQKWENDNRQLARAGLYVSQVFQQIGQYATVAGAAITAGIVKSANDYIKSGVEVNDVTMAWKGTSNQIADENLRIGRVMAATVLPAYKTLASFVGAIAAFFEAHPAAAQGAALAGVGLTLVGGLTIALAQGIRLVADVSYVTATYAKVNSDRQFVGGVASFGASVHEFIAGTKLQGVSAPTSAGSGLFAAAGGAVAITAITAGSLIVGSIAGEALGNWLGSALDKLNVKEFQNYKPQNLADAFVTLNKIELTPFVNNIQAWARSWPQITQFSNDFTETANAYIGWLQSILGATRQTAKEGTSANYGMSLAQKTTIQHQSVDEYLSYLDEEAKAAVDNQRKIADIRKQGAEQEQQIEQNNADAVARINSQFSTQLSNQYANFALNSQQAQETEALQRASIVKNEGEQIVKIEHDLQKKLRDMADEHNTKMYDLASARDALGLIREQRQYDKDVQKAKQDENDQIKQLKRETAIRLAEEDARFALEQQHRAEDFALQIQQETAAHAQQLAEQAKNYAEQKKKAEDDEKAKLETQHRNFESEERQRLIDFSKHLQNIYDQFNQEEKYRGQLYDTALGNLRNFLTQFGDDLNSGMLQALGGMPTLQPHDYTGYTRPGMNIMSVNGQPEFVLSGPATRAAERLLGGALSERVLMATLALGAGGGGQSVTWNDHRRFDGDVGAATRRQNRSDTYKILGEIFR